MVRKPTLLSNVAELRNVLHAMNVWEKAGADLDTSQGRRSFVDGLAREAVDELAGPALTKLRRMVLAERGRLDEDTMTDNPTVGAEGRPAFQERTAPARRATAGASSRAASSGNTELTYPPRQRSSRVIAAGWLRRSGESAAASRPAAAAQAPAVHA